MKMKSLFTILLAFSLFMPVGPLTAGEPPAVGSEAPGFKLQDQNGDWHDLEDYRGSWLAVYFYPVNLGINLCPQFSYGFTVHGDT